MVNQMSGVAQLVAIGQQDVHLTGNPEISFFRSTYKRHTNFSSVIETQVIQNSPKANAMSSVRFERKGDLLNSVYITRSDSAGATELVDWSTVIDHVELFIGGQQIDSQDFDFSTKVFKDLMACHSSRSAVGSQAGGSCVGAVREIHTTAVDATASAFTQVGTPEGNSYFYPLKFFFSENMAQSLPLAALAFHDVEIRIYWAAGSGRGYGPTGGAAPALITGNMDFEDKTYQVWAKFMYLDVAERELFVSTPQEMLIHQTQKVAVSGLEERVDLTFNHPVKFLASVGNEASFNSTNPIKIQLNGADVGDARPAVPHFNQVPSYYGTGYGTGRPHLHGSLAAVPVVEGGGFEDVTMVMPFCDDMARLQPTGSLNFSRLDQARLEIRGGTFTTPVYAVNYNILRITAGMGGLLYSS